MSNLCILLVEDDPTSVLLTQRIYQKSGLRAPLQTVHDAEEALAYLSGEQPYNQRDRYPLPALLLLDLKLPRMSGLQLLTWLRGQPQFENLPVVVLTTSRDPEDIQAAYDDGANTYLIKPITLEDLLDLGHTFGLQPEGGPRLLLVEELAEQADRSAQALAGELPDVEVTAVKDETEMSRALDHQGFDLAIAAYRQGWPEGLSILGQLKARWPNCPLILHVAAEDEEAAREALREGWDEMVIKSGGSPARLARAARIQLELARQRRTARRAEERYQRLTDSMPIGLFRATLRGQIVEANPTLRQMLGYGEQPFSTAYILPDLLVEDADRAAWQAGLQQDGTLRGFEAQIYGANHEIHWVEINAQLVLDAQGSPSYIQGSLEDVSPRKQAENRLRASEEKYRGLIEQSQDGILLIDEEGKVVEWNARLEELTGIARKDVLGCYTWEILERMLQRTNLDTMKGRNRAAIMETLRAGEIPSAMNSLDIELAFPEQPPIYLQALSFPIRTSRGFMIGCVIRDITERKRMDEALFESERRFRATLDNVRLIAVALDPPGNITYANDYLLALTGWQREEIMGKSWSELFIPREIENQKDFENFIAAGLISPEFVHHENEILTRQGERRTIHWNNTLLKGSDGSVSGVVSIGEDITERKKAEEALRSSERQSRTIIEQFVEGFLLVDEKGSVIEWNKAMEETTGISKEEALGRPYWDVQYRVMAAEHRTPLRHAQLKSVMQKMLHAGNSSYFLRPVEAFVQKTTGERRAIQQITFPIQFENGYRIGSIIQDITERKKREHELQVIASLSSALRSADNRAKMGPVIVDQMISLLNADAGSFETIDMVRGESLIEQARGAWASAAGARIPLGSGLNAYIIESGKPYHTNEALKDSRVVMADLYGDCQAAAGAPMIAQGQMIGFLWIGRKTRVSENEVQLLTAIADIAANAIHRANLHEQSERSVQRLAALHEIDTAISSSLDLQITLRVLLEQVISQLHVDAADVLLLNGITPQLNYAAGRGFKTRLLEKSTVRVGESFAGRAAMSRNTVEITDLDAFNDGSSIYKILASEGFHSYFAVPLFAKGQVTGVLEVHLRSRFTPDQDWLDFLRTLGGQAAIAIDNASLFNDLQRLASDLILAYDETIEGWSRALDLRDKETEGHTLRVTEMTENLARNMGVGDAEMVHIRRGALLHDIGKMGVPDAILLKPGKLTDDEWERMRKHPVYAYELLYPIKYLRPALDIPYSHHEKWDGTGYPRGLRGEQIPLAARLFALVDVWDALSYPRPYRPEAWPDEKIRAYVQDLSGTHFDPQVVEAFFRLLDED